MIRVGFLVPHADQNRNRFDRGPTDRGCRHASKDRISLDARAFAGLTTGMENTGAVSVPRPKRWDEPMDPSMSDADVAWLRTRQPFVSLDPTAFPRSMPLEGVLKNDCRLHRYLPGEVIVREGDYANSAFLVLSGTARVMVDSLSRESLGRQEKSRRSWSEALWQFFRPDEFPESRPVEAVIPAKHLAPEVKGTSANGDMCSNEGTDPQHSSSQGSCDRRAVYLQDFDVVLRDHDSVALEPGELFGEVAALYRSPRNATVVAETESTLLEIRWQGLKVLRGDKTFAEQLESHYRDQWLPMHLRELPLFRHVPEDRIARVVERTQMQSFGRLAWNTDFKKTRKLPPAEQIQSEPLVMDEGRVPTDLIIVRAGFGRLCRRHGDGHLTTAYIGKGQIFGLEIVGYNATRSPDQPPRAYENQLRAVGFLDTLHIPVEVFAEDVLPYVRREELPPSVSEMMISRSELRTKKLKEAGVDRRQGWRERRKTTRKQKPKPVSLPVVTTKHENQFTSTSLLEFIVQERLNNGQQAMVIDLNRCTRCDDCVKACAATHGGNPRFVRDGARHDHLQFVQACMQCTDPVCMIGCPTGAIVRDEESGVVEVHEPICIGCSTCANACPYDNIRMAEVFDQQGRPYRDQKSGKPITKATKCDMCHSQPSGPACVSACPHDAIVRIDLSESKPLEKWIEQRS
ncbi:MAG: cyclic nucleotide-binding domain-containing protein [Planctomycetota bacterium]